MRHLVLAGITAALLAGLPGSSVPTATVAFAAPGSACGSGMISSSNGLAGRSTARGATEVTWTLTAATAADTATTGTAGTVATGTANEAMSTTDRTFWGCWNYWPQGTCRSVYADENGNKYLCGRCGPHGEPNPSGCAPISQATLDTGYWCS